MVPMTHKEGAMTQEDWYRTPPTTAMMMIKAKPAIEPTCRVTKKLCEHQSEGLAAKCHIDRQSLDLQDLLGCMGPPPFDVYPDSNGDEKGHQRDT